VEGAKAGEIDPERLCIDVLAELERRRQAVRVRGDGSLATERHTDERGPALREAKLVWRQRGN
jgi:hypothetical protein